MKKLHFSFLLFAIIWAFNAFAQPGTVTNFTGKIGQLGQYQSTGAVTPNNATFWAPMNLCIDNSGKMWIIENMGNRVRMLSTVTTPSLVYPIAGSLSSGSGSLNNSPGSMASFNFPTSLVVDANGNIFVTDFNNNCIRKITKWISAGVPDTVSNYTPTDLTGGMVNGNIGVAKFLYPMDLAIDTLQYIYVADMGNNCIRKISPGGVVTTVAGSTAGGYAAGGFVDGIGTSAKFLSPMGLGWLNTKELLIADYANQRIRKLNIFTGAVTTVAGKLNLLGTIIDGNLSSATFYGPTDVAADSVGNIYVTEGGSLGDSLVGHTIRRISGNCVSTLAGLTHVTGTASGNGTAARFNYPAGITYYNGMLYVADVNNQVIRSVVPDHSVPPPAPVAQIANQVTKAFASTTYSFTDTSTGIIGNRVWRFLPNQIAYQGGTDSSSKTVKIQFAVNGPFTVSLQVNNCGGTNTQSFNLNVSYSGINELNSDAFVKVFPNPSNGKFDISIDGNQDLINYSVTDISGKLVFERKGASTQESIDLNACSKGIYLLHLSGKDISVTRKLILN